MPLSSHSYIVITVATVSITSRLKQIVGQLQNANDELSRSEMDSKNQRNPIAKPKVKGSAKFSHYRNERHLLLVLVLFCAQARARDT